MTFSRPIYIIDGSRTPFLKARGKPGPFSASDLAVNTARVLLARQSFSPEAFDEVITGCMMPSPDEANISRLIALRLGCGKKVPAWTVQRNCASGLQAIDSAAKDIASGRANLVLAGGTEAMSRAPILFNEKMVNFLAALNAAKTLPERVGVFTKFRLSFLSPIIALLRGLTDPLVGLNMGQTAEILAYQFQMTREQLDAFAVESHQRLAKALDENYLNEITPIYDSKGNVYSSDDGLRRDSSVEKLGTLKPFFDKKFGLVTAANSSQVTDGAAFLILASEEAVKKYHLKPLAKIVDCEWAGLAPEVMGLGPVFSSTPLLTRNHLALNDIDCWEINEAFAAQVLGCLAAWNDDTFCRTQLGLERALGQLDTSRLNTEGGAIAIGHPVGASGARLVLHVAETLKRKNLKRGIATLCIGGGQGGAMLIENIK